MTDYYLDPDAASGGDGSQGSPYKTFSQLAGKFIGGNAIYLKAGSRIPVDNVGNRWIIEKTGSGTLLLGAYGGGSAKPNIFANTPSTAFHLLELRSTTGSQGSGGKHVIMQDLSVTGSEFQGGIIRAKANSVVEDVLIRRSDFSGNGQSTTAKGADGLTIDTSKITIAGQLSITRRIRVEDSSFDDNGCHGTKARGASRSVQWVRCKSRRNGNKSPSHAFGGASWTVRPISPGITGYANQYSYVTTPWTLHTGTIFYTQWGATDNAGVAWAYPTIYDFKLCNINYLSQNRIPNNVMVGRMIRREPGSQDTLNAYEWCTDGVISNRIYCNFGTANVGVGNSPLAGTFLPSLELAYEYASDLYWEDCVAEDQFDYDGNEGSAFHMDDDSGTAVAYRCISKNCYYGIVVNGGEGFKVIGGQFLDCKKEPINIWCGPQSSIIGITTTGTYQHSAIVQGNGTALSDRISLKHNNLGLGSLWGIRELGAANYVRSNCIEQNNAFIGTVTPTDGYSNATTTLSPHVKKRWRLLPSGVMIPAY